MSCCDAGKEDTYPELDKRSCNGGRAQHFLLFRVLMKSALRPHSTSTAGGTQRKFMSSLTYGNSSTQFKIFGQHLFQDFMMMLLLFDSTCNQAI